MGLKADFEEVASSWTAAPWRVKLWLTLSLFLASNAIASLSETIFKWKGFILDAIDLYRSHISLPLRDLLVWLFSMHVQPRAIDVSMLVAIFGLASLRVAFYYPKRSDARKAELGAVVCVVGTIMVAIATSGKGPAFWFSLLIFLLSVLFSITSHIKHGGASALLWLVYVVAPFLAVGLVAAVNTGLSRS